MWNAQEREHLVGRVETLISTFQGENAKENARGIVNALARRSLEFFVDQDRFDAILLEEVSKVYPKAKKFLLAAANADRSLRGLPKIKR